MYKKIILLLIVCIGMMFSHSAFAEVGSQTATYQAMIKQTGAYYIKYNDYTEADYMSLWHKKQKRKPSSVITIACDGENQFYRNEYLNNWKTKATEYYLKKNGKMYKLDEENKEGILVMNSLQKSEIGSLIRNTLYGAVPTALSFIIPDELKSDCMKHDATYYKYQGTYEEKVKGKVYQCEEYSGEMPQKRIYKLYFQDGKLVKFAHGKRIMEVLEISSVADDTIFDIPSGFTIYAEPQGDMDELLKRKVVVEQY